MNTQLDTYNLRHVILEEYRQFEDGFRAVGEITIPKKQYTRVVVCGMGGSALPTGILAILLKSQQDAFIHAPVRIDTHRSYGIPSDSNENTLYIVCSHSGNTEETLSAFDAIREQGRVMVGVASGGKLEQRCKEYEVPFVKLPIPFHEFQPRMATGHFVSILVALLEQSKIIDSRVREGILATADILKTHIAEHEEQGKVLAQKLYQKTPIIYTSDPWGALAHIWKIKINENAKTPAFWNVFPEFNHNEMVGFTLPQAVFSFLLLRDPNDDLRILRRYEVFETLMKERGHSVEILDIQGETVYTRTFATLSLGDWISYYLALGYGIDPTPVDMVEDFKERIKESQK